MSGALFYLLAFYLTIKLNGKTGFVLKPNNLFNKIRLGILFGGGIFAVRLFYVKLFGASQLSVDSEFYLLQVLFVLFFAPIVEEMFFRGYVYRRLSDEMGWLCGMILSSYLFMMVHHSADNLLPLFLIGCFFAVIYEKTKSIIICSICHFFVGIHYVILNMNSGVIPSWTMIGIFMAIVLACYIVSHILYEKQRYQSITK